MTKRAPVTEFDPDRGSILMPDPFAIGVGTLVPARGVLCFFQDVLDELKAVGQLVEIGHLKSEMGKHPVYRYGENSGAVTVIQPGVGAPLAAAFLEELIACGVTKFTVCGGAGVLTPDIVCGHPVILTSAVRDEGTSFHYLPPSREVKPHKDAVNALKKACEETGVEYRLGKAWTTDAIYRETRSKRQARIAEGCEVVEMEAAALFAVSKFREIRLGQIVYGGDLVIPEGWDSRDWFKRSPTRHLMFELAVKAVRLL
jgi:uridine phosphorylase